MERLLNFFMFGVLSYFVGLFTPFVFNNSVQAYRTHRDIKKHRL